MICPICGEKVRSRELICKQCGYTFSALEQNTNLESQERILLDYLVFQREEKYGFEFLHHPRDGCLLVLGDKEGVEVHTMSLPYRNDHRVFLYFAVIEEKVSNNLILAIVSQGRCSRINLFHLGRKEHGEERAHRFAILAETILDIFPQDLFVEHPALNKTFEL